MYSARAVAWSKGLLLPSAAQMAVFMVNSCKFRGCNLIFETLAELIQHIEEAHIGKLTFLAHHHHWIISFNHHFYYHHDHSTLLPHSSSLISSLHSNQVFYYHHLYILSVTYCLSIIILIFHYLLHTTLLNATSSSSCNSLLLWACWFSRLVAVGSYYYMYMVEVKVIE
mgnify:FL=1